MKPVITNTREINRRTFLARLGLAGAGLALAPHLELGRSYAQGRSDVMAPAAFYPFKLGDLELVAVSDGSALFPTQLFTTNATPEEVNQTLADKFLPPDQVRLAVNCLVVKTGSETVLIDTGFGGDNPTAGKLLVNLAAAGVKPSDITSVVITHAHGDHIGGLLTPDGQATFPNARILVSQLE